MHRPAERIQLNMPCRSDAQCQSGLCHAFEDDRICVDRIQLSRSEPVCDDFR